MNEDLRARLEAYHEADEYEQIVEAVGEIPAADRDYELVSHLGRALNNLERYEEAAAQFLTVAEEGKDDPLWHYRLGLAYYYLEQYENAKREFTIADQLDPGDEDTLEFLEWIREKMEQEPAAEPGESSASEAEGKAAVNDAADKADEADGAETANAAGVPAAVGANVLAESTAALASTAVGSGTGDSDFWEDSAEASETYVLAPPSDELIASVEEELVFKLPSDYVEFMRIHNGGVPRNRVFPVQQVAAEEPITISAILGIGRDKSHSLCGDRGSRYLIEKEGFPEFGVVICECPDEHQAVMLDYREAGNDGEPEVVHVDGGNKNKVTRLAPNFSAFVQGLARDTRNTTE
ncbi:cell wall assembly protein [Paenibacillus yonginensis]|uniref:Cell wall assembly protein n=1 Tax=Paenibacillus yonginensis TaxID=1462996 RepID=A0A1B1N516_9BACL|nr:SMI1/KNR4 family protein [Paenibacillus yonginensis]ANS76538.1 cell wall assembly protein [Paenibacillus yonginensis]